MPVCAVTDEVPFAHYLLVEIPHNPHFKDAPTGKYLTIHGSGFLVLNVWLSDMVTEQMVLSAAGKSCVMTCIAAQKSGTRMLRTTSGTTLVTEEGAVPHSLVFPQGPANPPMMSGALAQGFEDVYVPNTASASVPHTSLTPPRPTLSCSTPPTPLSTHGTPHGTPVKSAVAADAFYAIAPLSSKLPSFTVSVVPAVKKVPHVCGLVNLQNTCYLNAILQALYACKHFGEPRYDGKV